MQMRRGRKRPKALSTRPPFENRYGSGEHGRRWYRELEYHGPEYVRIRLAQLESLASVAGIEPFTIPLGFAHDWLVFRARRDRLGQARWRTVIAVLALIAAVGGVIAATPVLQHWLAR